MKKIIQLAVATSIAIASSSILSGCSGHPGAGHWSNAAVQGSTGQGSSGQVSLDQSSSVYSALELEFDGKGVLHPNKNFVGQENKDDLKCLWQAKTANAVEVQCGNDTTDQEKIIFSLVISASHEEDSHEKGELNQANLLLGQQIVSSFIRTR